MSDLYRSLIAAALAALLATGCSNSTEESRAKPDSLPSSLHPSPATTQIPDTDVTIPRCSALPELAAPANWYRERPVYVGNEQPTYEVQTWASTKPGYVDVWIDRSHHGWITVSFTEQVDVRQRELEERFPEVGVVAVQVRHTTAELDALRARVTATFRAHGWSVSTAPRQPHDTVGIDVGVLSNERLAALDDFRGEPICVEGRDPGDTVADGPQRTEGDTWRLLGEGLGGQTYRTGIATNPDQYAALWERAGLTTGEAPPVDFATEVVVWFGAVYGMSCPIRMDDVVVESAPPVLHGVFVVPGNPGVCTADARPHAYVVAVLRSALPAGPFAIQLNDTDPPRGAPEERTIVDADLSVAGAVAAAAQIHADHELIDASDDPEIRESGAYVEVGVPFTYRMPARCGARHLGTVNGILWRTDAVDDARGLPTEWRALVDDAGFVTIGAVLTIDGPTIEATANGRTISYVPARIGETTDCE